MTNPRPAERYQEKAIQEACVGWLTLTWGYRETFDDKEAVGARFDSAGDLKGRLAMIEFKVDVSEAMVRHASDRSASLESKISGALRGLYLGRGDALSDAASQVWDRARPPLMVIAARSFSAAAKNALVDMLNQRSKDWRFDFAVWRWTGAAVDILAEGASPFAPSPRWLAESDVPILIGRTPRAKSLNLMQMRDIAADAGVADLFEAFIAMAKQRGMSLIPRRGTLGAGHRPPYGGTIFACYLKSSSAHLGLHVGIDAAQFGARADLPGSPAPIEGFLNLNRYLTTTDDVSGMFALLR